MVKYLRISSYIRTPFRIYDFATAFFISVYLCRLGGLIVAVDLEYERLALDVLDEGA